MDLHWSDSILYRFTRRLEFECTEDSLNPVIVVSGVGAAAVDDAEAAAAESMPTDEAAQDEYIDGTFYTCP